MTTKTKRKPAAAPDRQSISYRIREAIGSGGYSAYGVAKAAGVDPGVVQRFLAGERDIRLATADRIAAALGLKLVDSGRARARPRAMRPAPVVEVPAAEVP